MKIIINHLTRMGPPRICVAGVDASTFEHVRPTTPPSDLITRKLLRGNGGPFAVGALVDLGDTNPRPNAPEVEDHRFTTSEATFVDQLTDEEYIGVLQEVSSNTLEGAMGPDLISKGNRKWAVTTGTGERSLAVLTPRGRPALKIEFEKLRLHLSYPDAAANLSVADLRFYDTDHKTIRTDVVQDVNARLARGVDSYIMLGLSRPFPGEDQHWLQVNGVCLVDKPVGEVP